MTINQEKANNDYNNKYEKRKIIQFEEDIANPIYSKQFIFPSFNMQMDIRKAIVREVINYIKRTKRFPQHKQR